MRYGTKVCLITKNAPNFRELPTGEVRRIPLLRRWVNKGKEKGRGLRRGPAQGEVPVYRCFKLTPSAWDFCVEYSWSRCI